MTFGHTMYITHEHNNTTLTNRGLQNQNGKIMKSRIRLASVEYHCYYCSHRSVTQGITGQYEELCSKVRRTKPRNEIQETKSCIQTSHVNAERITNHLTSESLTIITALKYQELSVRMPRSIEYNTIRQKPSRKNKTGLLGS